jgi:hypothetical protein
MSKSTKGSEGRVVVTAYMTPEEDKALKEDAKANHRSRAGHLRHIALQHLNRKAS